MMQNASFVRKILYLALIALLLLPLYVIGHPATGDPTQLNSSPGGELAQLRTKHDLGIAELGEIDPAGESMKLATLGMRGIAANILWSKANYYKKTEDWEKLVATVNQMSKLQPNFISVWEFQSHNLSYNISVEHDDYRFRYLWVKKGIEFLIRGTRYNRNEPKLFWTLGWYTGQKFGRADEHTQFRRLFHDDDDFHNELAKYIPLDSEGRGGADNRPDNWLASRLWYESAYDIVLNRNAPIRGKAPHIFYADGPKSRMNYAAAIESEGLLNEIAEYAWKVAGEEWRQYGDRVVPTSWGERIRLNDAELKAAEAQRLADELDKLLPGLREIIRQEKIAKLPKLERETLEKPQGEITTEVEAMRYFTANEKVKVSYRDVADRAPPEIRARAFRLAGLAAESEIVAGHIQRYRENVNFQYWRTRCDVEQMRATVEARRHVYEAGQLAAAGDLDKARNEYEAAWGKWAATLQSNPDLVHTLTEDDLYEDLQKYLKLLAQLDEELPADFALNSVIKQFSHLDPATANALPAVATPTETPGNAAPSQPPAAQPTETTPSDPKSSEPTAEKSAPESANESKSEDSAPKADTPAASSEAPAAVETNSATDANPSAPAAASESDGASS